MKRMEALDDQTLLEAIDEKGERFALGIENTTEKTFLGLVKRIRRTRNRWIEGVEIESAPLSNHRSV